MKKRPFILLEILIAVSLIGICSVPLVLRPMRLYQTQTKLLWEMERERLAEWTFSEIKEILFQNKIPWDRLPKYKGGKTASFPLPPVSLSIPGGRSKSVSRKFSLMCKGEKTGKNDELYRLLYVTIQFNDPETQYIYRVIVQRLVAQNKENKA